MARAGMIDRVLQLLQNNAEDDFDVPKIETALNIPRNNIYQALHELTKGGEINRLKKKSGLGSIYWYGDQDKHGELPPAVVAAGADIQPNTRTKASSKRTRAAGRGLLPQLSPVVASAGASAHDEETDIAFAITEHGELGVSVCDGDKKINVAIPTAAVRRLNQFLRTTAALWGER